MDVVCIRNAVFLSLHHVGEVRNVADHLRKSRWGVGEGERLRGKAVLGNWLGGQGEVGRQGGVGGEPVEVGDRPSLGLRRRAKQVEGVWKGRRGVVVAGCCRRRRHGERQGRRTRCWRRARGRG